MKKIFSICFVMSSLLSFRIDHRSILIRRIIHQAGITDSIIEHYRREWKIMMLSVYNDDYYSSLKASGKEHISADSVNVNRKNDSLIDAGRIWEEKAMDHAEYRLDHEFRSADSLFKAAFVKKLDCIEYCRYTYKGETIRISTLNYDTDFKLYYTNGQLILFVDTAGGPCYSSKYHARFYFNNALLIAQKIHDKPECRRYAPLGNRCAGNVFNRQDSILSFSHMILKGIIKNSCAP